MPPARWACRRGDKKEDQYEATRAQDEHEVEEAEAEQVRCERDEAVEALVFGLLAYGKEEGPGPGRGRLRVRS